MWKERRLAGPGTAGAARRAANGPGAGDQPDGGAPRSLEMQRPPRGSRDRRRSPGAAPGPARPPAAEPLLPLRGWDSAARGPEGRGPRAGPQSGSARPQSRVGSSREVALIHLVRPDGSRSPQHGFVFLVFSLGLFSLIGVFTASGLRLNYAARPTQSECASRRAKECRDQKRPQRTSSGKVESIRWAVSLFWERRLPRRRH